MIYLNDLPSVKAVLEHYGAVIRRDHGQVNLKCPFHGDTHQSGTANLDDNVFVCFACGVQGNSLQLIVAQEGCTIREAARIAEGFAGESVSKVRGKYSSGRGLPSKPRNKYGSGSVGTLRRSGIA